MVQQPKRKLSIARTGRHVQQYKQIWIQQSGEKEEKSIQHQHQLQRNHKQAMEELVLGEKEKRRKQQRTGKKTGESWGIRGSRKIPPGPAGSQKGCKKVRIVLQVAGVIART